MLGWSTDPSITPSRMAERMFGPASMPVMIRWPSSPRGTRLPVFSKAASVPNSEERSGQ